MEVALQENHPLFGRVEKALLAAVLEHSDSIRVSKGDTVYDRHRFRRCLGVVLEGSIQVQKDALLVSTLSENDVFGAAALFNDREDYPTTLTALQDCQLLLIPQEGIRQLLRESPAFAEDYVTYLSGRIQFLSARLDTLSASSAEGKLGQYLLSAADENGDITLSATQLSARIGVGRASLYRAFESLEQSGAIARRGKTIRILSREKLQN
jgi:CRP-like cAMP-binding protein